MGKLEKSSKKSEPQPGVPIRRIFFVFALALFVVTVVFLRTMPVCNQ